MGKIQEKLQEEQMVTQMPPIADPIPANEPATNNIADASTIPADPFTPPAPGMVPTGWAMPQQLAAAIAQETGDVTPAQTAPDAMVAPDLGAISPEEQQVVLEYRKLKDGKIQESAEDDVDEKKKSDSIADAPADFVEEGITGETTDKLLGHSKVDEEVKVKDSKEKPCEDDFEDVNEDLFNDDIFEVEKEPEEDAEEVDEDISIYDKIMGLFDDVPSDEIEEVLGDLPDALRDSADYIDSLLSDSFDEKDDDYSDFDEDDDLEESIQKHRGSKKFLRKGMQEARNHTYRFLICDGSTKDESGLYYDRYYEKVFKAPSLKNALLKGWDDFAGIEEWKNLLEYISEEDADEEDDLWDYLMSQTIGQGLPWIEAYMEDGEIIYKADYLETDLEEADGDFVRELKLHSDVKWSRWEIDLSLYEDDDLEESIQKHRGSKKFLRKGMQEARNHTYRFLICDGSTKDESGLYYDRYYEKVFKAPSLKNALLKGWDDFAGIEEWKNLLEYISEEDADEEDDLWDYLMSQTIGQGLPWIEAYMEDGEIIYKADYLETDLEEADGDFVRELKLHSDVKWSRWEIDLSLYEDDDLEESIQKHRESIIYPAGSKPKSSEIVEEDKKKPANTVNAVREARRAAFNRFKESRRKRIQESKEMDPRFREALKGVFTKARKVENSNSWSSNNFIDRYTEAKKLDFNSLLRNGFLG